MSDCASVKIAFIFCGFHTAAWSVSDGIVNELRRMGHTVLAAPRGRADCPRLTVEGLNMADAILVSGPEHIFEDKVHRRPNCTYPYALAEDELTVYEWKHALKPPKLFWYHESCRREDRNFAFQDFLALGDFHFFPAVQDAETFDQAHFALDRSFWLPFGVDTEVFRPSKCMDCGGSGRCGEFIINEKAFGGDARQCKECLGSGVGKNEKTVEAGFIGLLYQKREAFLSRLAEHMKRGRDPTLTVGNVYVQDIEGIPHEEMARRLAENYRRISVFLNFPHLSELLVTKVYEVMACGTFLMTPLLSGSAEANCEQFKEPVQLAYYNPANLPFIVQMMREFMGRPELREQIALAGMVEIRAKHTLRQRLEEMFAKAKIEARQPEAAKVN